MKWFFIKWFVFAGLFIGGFSFLAAQTGEGPSSVARIREITGTVELKAANQETWVRALPGDHLERETVISTGFKSTAVLTLGNSSLFVLPLTRLSLGELSARENDERVDLGLRAGRIRAEVRPPVGGKVEFTVRSPIATASVRGTVFEFDTVNLRVSEGTVNFTPAETGGIPPRTVPVSSGENSFVDTLTASAVMPAAIDTANLFPPAPAGSGASIGPAETSVTVPRTRPAGSLSITVNVTEKGK
jgi:hypothetical protein